MKQRRAAFTLLELILATAIAAMMSLAIYSAMTIAFKARQSAIAQTQDVQSASIAMDLIEQDLQSILPPIGTLSGPMVGYAMGTPGAEADSIDFHCIGRDRDSTSVFNEGFRRVQLVLRTDTPVPTLVRRVRRNLLTTAVAEPVEETLSSDVIGFSLRYYDGTSWYQEWDSVMQEDALPLAIELTIRVNPHRDRAATQPYSLTRLIKLPCATTTATEEEAEVTNAPQ